MKPADVEIAIRKLRPFFGSTLATECGIAKQTAYKEWRLTERYGMESIRRDLSVLSAALNLAERHTKIPRAPAMLTIKPNPPRERWLTRDEVAKLFRQMRKPHRGKRFHHLMLFARLALYTGARTGAILDLTWDRVRFDAGLIDYRVPGRRVTKKARVISHMTPALRRMLLHAKKRARSRHVIEWAGQRIDRVAKAVNSHADLAGIEDFSPHVLRHTFASWAVQKGVPIYAVGKALGQTVASTTERYAKLAPKDIAAVMEAVRRK
jgi:integrase